MVTIGLMAKSYGANYIIGVENIGCGKLNELVTVILTTYNNPIALLSSIASVINQTYKNLEIMIVDGGTNKHTKKAVDIFKDKRIIYVKTSDTTTNRNRGEVQRCRNLGVTLAQGKYIAMLDDDDVWRKDKIDKQMKLMSITHASLIVTQTKKTSGKSSMIDKPPDNPTFNDLLQAFNFSQTSTYFMNKNDLLRCGGFNEKLRTMHEYDVALRMAKQKMKIAVVQEPLLISDCENATERKYYFLKIAETLDLWRCYGNDICQLPFKQLVLSIAKTITLISLYAMGYIIKEKIWALVFKLKEGYQK